MTFTHPLSRRPGLLGSAGLLAVSLGLLALTSCAKTSSNPNPTGPTPVASVAMNPASATITMGNTTTLTATPEDAGNNPLTGRTVTWSSDNTAVATVDGSGLVTAVAAGTAHITATCEGKSANATITVSAVPVASVTVTPASANVAQGSTRQLVATPKDASNNPLTGRVVTWSSDNTAAATVNGSGLVTAVAAGSATITATCETKTGTSAITVTAVPVASVTVTPASANVAPGSTVQLTATPRDASNNPLTGRTVTWSSDNTAVATVNGSGLVTGVAVGGPATIIATCETKTGTSAITVAVVPVASVTVTPASTSVQTGSTVQLTATPKDASNNPLTGRTVTWSSGNTALATVNSSGLVTGVAAGGPVTITATCETKTGTSAVSVTTPGSGEVLVGAGDIAESGGEAEATATLLDGISGTVFTAGDNAYPDGTTSDFANNYDPTWGRHKARTRPCPGNHDYHTNNAAPYYAYFGANAGTAGLGYYSYDLGTWHIISLNSEIDMSAGSPQEQWLRADLAAHPVDCTLAYWHEPRFSSGDIHGDNTACSPLWQALQDYGAEIIICGHDHEYERFAPQDVNGTADPTKGIREFVVGTGGAGLYSITNVEPNSEAHDANTFGVLKLTLGVGTYSWQFIPIAGETYTDSGSGTCHK